MLSYTSEAWGNSGHFATPQLVSPQNYVWERAEKFHTNDGRIVILLHVGHQYRISAVSGDIAKCVLFLRLTLFLVLHLYGHSIIGFHAVLFGWVQSKIKITKLTGDIASFLMAVLWGWWLLSKGDFFTGDLVESCFNAELEWSLMLAFSFTGFDELNKIYVEAELRIQNWTIIRLLRTHSMMLLILFT